jgi:hypothetical protein
VRFAFHDARHDLGHLLEIYEPYDSIVSLYETVARASIGWRGDDPLRQI